MKPGYMGSFYVCRVWNGNYWQSRLFPFPPTCGSPPGSKLVYRVHVYKKVAK